MAHNLEIAQVDLNTIEIHYLLSDNSHLMDANVENKCSFEILGIIREVAAAFSLEIVTETEPIGEGGLRRWLRITTKEEDKKGTITTAIITALIMALLISPIGKFSEKLIDRLFEETELQDLQKEKLKLEIQKLKEEAKLNGDNLESNIAIKKRRSNFYETLDKYPKVDRVSFSLVDENKEHVVKEKTIAKDVFKEFILATDDLKPVEVEEAVIEIIAPVLKKGNYKWIGIYEGDPVSFSMKSDEFKALVQNGNIEFKNGSSINCLLLIKQKINSEGLIMNVGYEVLRVNNYFENENPIETKEGKHHRQIKEAQKAQLNLFGSSPLALDDD